MNKNLLRAFLPPLAFALFPILFLFSHNRAELLFLHELWLPLGAAFVSALISFLAAFVLLRQFARASILASLLVCAFWYYGFFYEILYPILVEKTVLGQDLWRQKTILPAWMLLWSSLMILSLKFKPHFLREIQKPIFFALFLLLLIPVSNIARYEFFYTGYSTLLHKERVPSFVLADESVLPDIYYIIPDGYAHSAVLSEFFEYDNRQFLEFLSSQRFQILKDSKTKKIKLACSQAGTRLILLTG